MILDGIAKCKHNQNTTSYTASVFQMKENFIPIRNDQYDIFVLFIHIGNELIVFTAKYVNHKGRSRHFTSPEELEEQRKKKNQR